MLSSPLPTARRRMTQGELDCTLEAHERLVEGRPGGRRAVLSFANLSGLDLSGRNLSEADLSGAVLEGAKAMKANFERANLFGSDLRRADFRGANLRRADLRGASLRGANLSQADLTQADFRVGRIAVADRHKGLEAVRHVMRPGELDDANLSGATLDESQLDGSSAYRTDFADCSMRG